MTPLFMALVLIEIADVIFAVDSVPAIFAITTDPFIVYTSNIFAILGLRALYFALAAMVHRFHYLKYALAFVLIFIGSKIFVADMLDLAKIPPVISLGVTFGILAAGVGWSLWKTRDEPAEMKQVTS
jgi:tellurite resistance protein TerC